MVGLTFVEGVYIGLNGAWQEGGTHFAVGCSEASAKGPGESMNGAESDMGECDAAEECSVGHSGACC